MLAVTWDEWTISVRIMFISLDVSLRSMYKWRVILAQSISGATLSVRTTVFLEITQAGDGYMAGRHRDVRVWTILRLHILFSSPTAPPHVPDDTFSDKIKLPAYFGLLSVPPCNHAEKESVSELKLKNRTETTPGIKKEQQNSKAKTPPSAKTNKLKLLMFLYNIFISLCFYACIQLVLLSIFSINWERTTKKKGHFCAPQSKSRRQRKFLTRLLVFIYEKQF